MPSLLVFYEDGSMVNLGNVSVYPDAKNYPDYTILFNGNKRKGNPWYEAATYTTPHRYRVWDPIEPENVPKRYRTLALIHP